MEEDQYIIIRHRRPETLSARVSEAIRRGYMPWGSLMQDDGQYMQAMIKTMNPNALTVHDLIKTINPNAPARKDNNEP